MEQLLLIIHLLSSLYSKSVLPHRVLVVYRVRAIQYYRYPHCRATILIVVPVSIQLLSVISADLHKIIHKFYTITTPSAIVISTITTTAAIRAIVVSVLILVHQIIGPPMKWRQHFQAYHH